MENFQIAIVFLDKNGFDLYTPTQESLLRFTFPKDAVQDMEVMQTELFISSVTSFITTYQIPMSMVSILISQDLLFMKDIQTTFPSANESAPANTLSLLEQQKLIKQFLDTVPFEMIENKSFPIQNGIRVVATNKALYDGIRLAFEHTGSTVQAVIPAFMLGTTNQGEGLTDEVVTAVINMNEQIKQESFVIHAASLLPLTPEEKKKEFLSLPKKQTKLYAYAGVFIVLLGILGFMYKAMLNSNGEEKKVNTESPVIARVVATATPTPTIVIALNAVAINNSPVVDKTAIKLQIQTTPATATQGQLIKNKLAEIGYTNILINPNAPTATAKTLVIFSSAVTPSVQTDITTVIKNIFTNFSTQQSTGTQFDITIIPSTNL